jgi:hypothetical protein
LTGYGFHPRPFRRDQNPGTGSSNPAPSSGESTNHRFLPDFVLLAAAARPDKLSFEIRDASDTFAPEQLEAADMDAGQNRDRASAVDRRRLLRDGAAIQTGVHSVTVELDFVQPVRTLGRLLDEPGELRFDPTGERRRLGATPSGERARHVFRHGALAPRGSIRPDFTR